MIGKMPLLTWQNLRALMRLILKTPASVKCRAQDLNALIYISNEILRCNSLPYRIEIDLKLTREYFGAAHVASSLLPRTDIAWITQ